MGNDPQKKSKISNEYITFEAIQETLGIIDPSLFVKYLQEVFVDLSKKINKNKNEIFTTFNFL